MNRTQFTFLLACLWSSSVVAAERPNIVFILADDWGWGDLGCHGHPYVKTPNIDRLAAEGTDFHRFTVASGVCSPSRTAVMTGHFPARYNIDGHFAWVPSNAKRNMPDWLDPQVPLLSRFLQESGYATAHFGKWHLSNNMIPDSPLPSEYGFDTYGAFNCAGEQMPVHEDARHACRIHREKPPRGKTVLHQPVGSRAAHAIPHGSQVSVAFSRASGAGQHLCLRAVSCRRSDRRRFGSAGSFAFDRQHARHFQLGQWPRTSRSTDGTHADSRHRNRSRLRNRCSPRNHGRQERLQSLAL